MASRLPSGNDDNGDKKAPREAKKRVGYECEFVEPPQEQFQSECPICLQILREPFIVDCCGYSFCSACIERAGKAGKPCPHCNQPGYTTLVNKGLKRALNEFRVYCPHRLRGCEWMGELGKLEKHLNSDPQPQRQLEGCPFAVIECLYCKENIRRDKIAGHQLERCPQRPYTCEYCAEYKSTFEDVAHSHWPECKCFLLPCPNECKPSGSGLQRQCLDQHVKEDCPLTVMQCKLHHTGCEVSLPRRDMANHMKEDSITHISLLTLELTRTKQELMSQSQELTMVKSELKEAQRLAINRFETIKQLDPQKLRMLVEMQCDIVPVIIEVTGFAKLKKNNATRFSRPFYTGMGGYKMCLHAYANGNFAGESTHVSVYTCLMRGEFDSRLMWPFRGIVTIQLVNQLNDKEHCTRTIPYTDTTPDIYATRMTDKERSCGWGVPKFILHSELDLHVAHNCQYLKDDSIIFRIVSITLNWQTITLYADLDVQWGSWLILVCVRYIHTYIHRLKCLVIRLHNLKTV